MPASYLLTVLIFLPLAGAGVLLLLYTDLMILAMAVVLFLYP